MDAVAVIDRANAVGLHVAVVGDRLSVTGKKTAESAAVIRMLADLKPAIIAHLTKPAMPDIAPFPPADVPVPDAPLDHSVYGIATLAEALAIQERWTVEHGPSVCGMLANGTFYVRPRWWKPFVNPRRTTYRPDGEANNG